MTRSLGPISWKVEGNPKADSIPKAAVVEFIWSLKT